MGEEILGKYKLLQKIGEGATAEVYRALDTELDRDVALKILKPSLVTDPGSFRRFMHEARFSGRLFHGNIATVLEMGEAQGRYYIALQYIDGESLGLILQQGTTLSWPEALKMVRQIGTALEYAHGEGFLHRDIKPENILRDKKGNYYLTDFGLTKAMMAIGLTSHTGAILGTPPYIAPEIWEGKQASSQSDQYALACVLVEALTGERVFQGDTPPAVMLSHIMARTNIPDVWPEGVPEHFREVILKALHKEGDARFECVGDFLQALGDSFPENSGKIAPSIPFSSVEESEALAETQPAVVDRREILRVAESSAAEEWIVPEVLVPDPVIVQRFKAVPFVVLFFGLASAIFGGGVIGVIGAIGLFMKKNWGRTFSIIFSFLLILASWGALGGVMVYFLTNPGWIFNDLQILVIVPAAMFIFEIFLYIVMVLGSAKYKQGNLIRSKNPGGLLPIALGFWLTVIGFLPALNLFTRSDGSRKMAKIFSIFLIGIFIMVAVIAVVVEPPEICSNDNVSNYRCRNEGHFLIFNWTVFFLSVFVTLIFCSYALRAFFYLNREEVKAYYRGEYPYAQRG